MLKKGVFFNLLVLILLVLPLIQGAEYYSVPDNFDFFNRTDVKFNPDLISSATYTCADINGNLCERFPDDSCELFINSNELEKSGTNLCSNNAGCVFLNPPKGYGGEGTPLSHLCNVENYDYYNQPLLSLMAQCVTANDGVDCDLNSTFQGYDSQMCNIVLCSINKENEINGTISVPQGLNVGIGDITVNFIASLAVSNSPGYKGIVELKDNKLFYRIQGLPDNLPNGVLSISADSKFNLQKEIKKNVEINTINNIDLLFTIDVNVNLDLTFKSNGVEILNPKGYVTVISEIDLREETKDFSDDLMNFPDLPARNVTVFSYIDGYEFKKTKFELTEDINIKEIDLKVLTSPKHITLTVKNFNDVDLPDVNIYFKSTGNSPFSGFNKTDTTGNSGFNLPVGAAGYFLFKKFGYVEKIVNYDSTNFNSNIQLDAWVSRKCSEFGGDLYLRKTLLSENKYCSSSGYINMYKNNISFSEGNVPLDENNIDDYVCCTEIVTTNLPFKDTDYDGVFDHVDVCPKNALIQTKNDPLYSETESPSKSHEDISFCQDGVDNDCDGAIDNLDDDCNNVCSINNCNINDKEYCFDNDGTPETKTINKDTSGIAILDDTLFEYCSQCQSIDSAFCQDKLLGQVDYECCNNVCETPEDIFNLNVEDSICSANQNVCKSGTCVLLDSCVQNTFFGKINILDANAENSCVCGSTIVDYNNQDESSACCINGNYYSDCNGILNTFKIKLSFYDQKGQDLFLPFSEQVQLLIIPRETSNIKPFRFDQTGSNGIITGLLSSDYTLIVTAVDRNPEFVEITKSDFEKAVDNSHEINKRVEFKTNLNLECANKEPNVNFKVSSIKSEPNSNITWTNPCSEYNESNLITHYLIKRTKLNYFDFRTKDLVTDYTNLISNSFGVGIDYRDDGFLPSDYASEFVALIPNNKYEIDSNSDCTDESNSECALKDEFGRIIHKENWTYVDELDKWGIELDGNKNSYLYEMRAYYVGNRHSKFSIPDLVLDYRINLVNNNEFLQIDHLSNRFSENNFYSNEMTYIGDSNTITNVNKILSLTNLGVDSQKSTRMKFLSELKNSIFNSGHEICTYYKGEFCAEYINDDYASQNVGLLDDNIFTGNLDPNDLKQLISEYSQADKFNSNDLLQNVPSVRVECNQFNFPKRIENTAESICFSESGVSGERYPFVCSITSNPNKTQCIKYPDLLNSGSTEFQKFRHDILKDTDLGFGFNSQNEYNEPLQQEDPISKLSLITQINVKSNLYTSFDRGDSVYDTWQSCTDALIPLNKDETYRESGCYGYRSKNACLDNPCNFGYEGKCEYYDSGFSENGDEISKGFCYDSKPIVNHCDLVNTDDLYQFGNITENICSNLGQCYLGKDQNSDNDFVCLECTQATTCSDYKSETACTSSDVCQLNNCLWNLTEEKCSVDKNLDGISNDGTSNENYKINSFLNLNNNNEYELLFRSYPNDEHKKISADIDSFYANEKYKLTSTAFKLQNGDWIKLNSDEFQTNATLFNENPTDEQFSFVLETSGDVNSAKTQLLNTEFEQLDSNAIIVNLSYFTLDNNGLQHNKKTRNVLIDNLKPNISIVFSELERLDDKHDILVLRSADELIFDSNGKRNKCDDKFELFNFETNAFVEIPSISPKNNVYFTNNKYQFLTEFSFSELDDGLYKFSSKCKDLAGNVNEKSLSFILNAGVIIKNVYPLVGEVVAGPQQDFSAELYREAKQCKYELYFNGARVNVTNKNNFKNDFNSKFKFGQKIPDYDINENKYIISDNAITFDDLCSQPDDEFNSRSCRTSSGTFSLNSTFSSGNVSFGFDFSNNIKMLNSFQTGSVFINASCLVQNGTDFEEFVPKNFSITQFYIDRLPPKTEILTIPSIATSKNTWLNYEDLKGSGTNVGFTFSCTDYPNIDGTNAGCDETKLAEYYIVNYGTNCIGNAPYEFAPSLTASSSSSISKSSTLCYRSIDTLGNKEDVNSINFLIDTEFPAFELNGISKPALDKENIANDKKQTINNYIEDYKTKLYFNTSDKITNISKIKLYKKSDNSYSLIDIYDFNTETSGLISIDSKSLDNKNVHFSFVLPVDDNITNIKIEVEDFAGNINSYKYYLFYDLIKPELYIDFLDKGFDYLSPINFEVSLDDNKYIADEGYNFISNTVFTKINIIPDKLHNFNISDGNFKNKQILKNKLDFLNTYFDALIYNQYHNYEEFGLDSKTANKLHNFDFETKQLTGEKLYGLNNFIPGTYNITLFYEDNYGNGDNYTFKLYINPIELLTPESFEVNLYENSKIIQIVNRTTNAEFEISSNQLITDIISFSSREDSTSNTHIAYKTDTPDYSLSFDPNLKIKSDYNLPVTFQNSNIEFSKDGTMLNINNAKFHILVKDIFGTEYDTTIGNDIAVDFKGPENYELKPNLKQTIDIFTLDYMEIPNRYQFYDSSLYDEYGLITNKENFYISGTVNTRADKPKLYSKNKTNLIYNTHFIDVSEYHETIGEFTVDYVNFDPYKKSELMTTANEIYLTNKFMKSNEYMTGNFVNHEKILSSELDTETLGTKITFANLIQDKTQAIFELYEKESYPLSFFKIYDLEELHGSALPEAPTKYNFDLKVYDHFNNDGNFKSNNKLVNNIGFNVTYDGIAPSYDIIFPKERDYIIEDDSLFNLNMNDDIKIESIHLNIVRKKIDGTELIISETFNNPVNLFNKIYANNDIGINADGNYFYNFTIKDVAGNLNKSKNIDFFVLRGAPQLVSKSIGGNKVEGDRNEYINTIKKPNLVFNFSFNDEDFEWGFNVSNFYLERYENGNWIIIKEYDNYNLDFNSIKPHKLEYDPSNRLLHRNYTNFTFFIEDDIFNAKETGELDENKYRLHFNATKGKREHLTYINFDYAPIKFEAEYYFYFVIDNTDPDIDFNMPSATNLLNFDFTGFNNEINLFNVSPLPKLDFVKFSNNDAGAFNGNAKLEQMENDNQEIILNYGIKLTDKALNEKTYNDFSILYDRKIPDTTWTIESLENNIMHNELGKHFSNNDQFTIRVSTSENVNSNLIVEQKINDEFVILKVFSQFTSISDTDILNGKFINLNEIPISFFPLKDTHLKFTITGTDYVNNNFENSTEIIIDKTPPKILDFKPLSASQIKPNFKFKTNEFANCNLFYENIDSNNLITTKRLSQINIIDHSFIPNEDITTIQRALAIKKPIPVNLSIECEDKRGNFGITKLKYYIDYSIPNFVFEDSDNTCTETDCIKYKTYFVEEGDYENNVSTINLLAHELSEESFCYYIKLDNLTNYNYSNDDFNIINEDFDNIYSKDFDLNDPNTKLSVTEFNKILNTLTNKRIIPNNTWTKLKLNEITQNYYDTLILNESQRHIFVGTCLDKSNNSGYSQVLEYNIDFDGPVSILFDEYNKLTNKKNHIINFYTRRDAICDVDGDNVIYTERKNGLYEYNYEVELSEGNNEFDINCNALNERGIANSKMYDIVLDITPPNLIIHSDNEIMTDDYKYELSIESNELFDLNINNLLYGYYDIKINDIEKNKKQNYTLSLNPALNIFVINISDKAGNIAGNLINIVRLTTSNDVSDSFVGFPGDGAIINKLNRTAAVFSNTRESHSPINLNKSILYLESLNNPTKLVYGNLSTKVCKFQPPESLENKNDNDLEYINITTENETLYLKKPILVHSAQQKGFSLHNNIIGDFAKFNNTLFNYSIKFDSYKLNNINIIDGLKILNHKVEYFLMTRISDTIFLEFFFLDEFGNKHSFVLSDAFDNKFTEASSNN
ncbi:hypothetical protein HN415_05760, partial [Candidatus Woesearchaeota archaeon]|nr:hypothetical protein [Candidatus Woesearchaeota archaeon]